MFLYLSIYLSIYTHAFNFGIEFYPYSKINQLTSLSVKKILELKVNIVAAHLIEDVKCPVSLGKRLFCSV